MIPYSFHPEARADFAAAALYYESQQPRLGDSFVEAVEQAISLIRQYPGLGVPLDGSVRRALVRRFPYGIIYRVEAGEMLIAAVADTRRSPDYWRHRV